MQPGCSSPAFLFFDVFHICQQTECLAQRTYRTFNSLPEFCDSVPKMPRWLPSNTGRVVLRCDHMKPARAVVAAAQNRNCVSILRLSGRCRPAPWAAASRSVYGRLPESGCLGRQRFCKFRTWMGLGANRPRQIRDLGPGRSHDPGKRSVVAFAGRPPPKRCRYVCMQVGCA